jgi:hypothetical protein
VAARALAVAVLASWLGCRSEPPRATPGDAGAAPTSSASAAAAPSKMLDARWQRAAGDDPLDAARLAEAVGAAGLLEGIDEGGEASRVALLALPHADDGELALRRVCELLAASAPGKAEPVLEAVLGVAGQPRKQREPLDPEGARGCGDVLVRIAADAARPRPERALAVSAARAFAEKGQLDAARIPKDLDPR